MVEEEEEEEVVVVEEEDEEDGDGDKLNEDGRQNSTGKVWRTANQCQTARDL